MGNLRVVSHSGEPFQDRREAGRILAQELKRYTGKNAVVLGIPRGGVIIAAEVASEIEGELDIVLSRKLGAPGNPELAVGAISEDGKLFLHHGMISAEEAARSEYVKGEKARQVKEIIRRIDVYRKVRPKATIKKRTIIITDDGLATGATMQAAIWSARQEAPEKIVVAVPVAPEETAVRIAREADETIILKTPPFFTAVGQFYTQFDQTSDEEVIEILRSIPK